MLSFVLFPIVAVISLLTLSPLVFNHVTTLAPVGQVSTVAKGPGILLFIGIVIYLFIAAFYTLVKKINQAEGILKSQLKVMFYGLLCTFLLIAIFNFLLPAVFNDLGLAPLGALFILPFIAATFYAMDKYKFLNTKVVAATFLIFVLAVLSFAEIIFSTTLTLILFRSGIFLMVLGLGILLIRTVLREVQQRELIEQQEKSLEIANARQENLLHFISHEVKGYFTRSAAAFAAITEGDYGAISPELKTLSSTALAETRKGVETVMEILDAGNFKKGTVKLAHEPFDLKVSLEKTITDFQPAAQGKHLTLDASVPTDTSFTVVGDEPQLRKHVIGNLIDNAIRYTPQGSVQISLSQNGTTILFTVRDTGVGITPEDMGRLFTEGGRGTESVKINVHSTGYGLFIAKSIVEQHGGRIWAESQGAGKGTTFFVELPAAASALQ